MSIRIFSRYLNPPIIIFLIVSPDFGSISTANCCQFLNQEYIEDAIRYTCFFVAGDCDGYYPPPTFAQTELSENVMINDGLRNNYDGGVNFYPKYQVNDSTFAMSINAYELKQHVGSRAFRNSTPKYPEKKKELEKLGNRLNESDNPVLILMKF